MNLIDLPTQYLISQPIRQLEQMFFSGMAYEQVFYSVGLLRIMQRHFTL